MKRGGRNEKEDSMNKIKEFRKKKNLSQSDLAEKMKVKQNTFSQWENDIRIPNVKYTANKDIVFLDIDSITTPEYPNLDVIPTQLELYMVNGGKHGVNAQLAMFNKFTNTFLQEDYYKKRIVLDKDGMVLMKSLINARPDSAFDHEYLYEHIKKI